MKMPQNNLLSIVAYFKSQLLDFYGDSEILAMRNIMLAHYFGLSRTDIALNPHQLFSESDLLKVIDTVKKLKEYQPLAYILGAWEFYGLTFKVDKNTLIPRPETEELVALIVAENPTVNSILDIGTGSGCIALSLKSELPKAIVSAWDVSEKALHKVTENATLNQLKIEVTLVDILKSQQQVLAKKIEVIVSNPPYITMEEKQLMRKNVLDYEPHLALFIADSEPLLFYDAISNFAQLNLTVGGKLYFEINEKYGQEVKELLSSKSFKKVLIIKDINGKDRIVKAEL